MRENGDCNDDRGSGGSRGRLRVLRVGHAAQLHQPRCRIHQPPRCPDEEEQGADERMRGKRPEECLHEKDEGSMKNEA
eukprot:5203030-Pyramimonas_sp.AAC.1